MSNPIEVVKSFYAALGRGDVSSLLATLDDDLEWTEAERFPYYSGTWHSPQEVCDKLVVPLSRDWEGFAATPHDFIANGERVVSLGTYSGMFKTTGKSMRAPFADCARRPHRSLHHVRRYDEGARGDELIEDLDIDIASARRC